MTGEEWENAKSLDKGRYRSGMAGVLNAHMPHDPVAYRRSSAVIVFKMKPMKMRLDYNIIGVVLAR